MKEGKQLKNAIAGHGLTQEQAAEKLGVARQTLSNWFRLDEFTEEIRARLKEKLNLGSTDQGESLNQNQMSGNDFLYQQLIKEKDRVIELLQKRVEDLER